MIDILRLEQLADDMLELRIGLAYGTTEACRVLSRFLRHTYSRIAPEVISGQLAVVVAGPLPERLLLTAALTQAEGAIHELIRFPAVICIQNDGGYSLWNETALSPCELHSSTVLTYVLDDGSEAIWVRGECITLGRPPCSARSLFSPPTFWELESALRFYGTHRAMPCIGRDLESCWADERRLRWTIKPESALRDSLWVFLRDTVRGADIKREHIVDSSKPVDIRVLWNPWTQALIEVKWLGVSVDEAGEIRTCYTAFRARKGAVQLRDYVTRASKEAPTANILGYLVVFDGRRRGVRNPKVCVGWDDAWAYRNESIGYPERIRGVTTLRLSHRFFVGPNVEPEDAE